MPSTTISRGAGALLAAGLAVAALAGCSSAAPSTSSTTKATPKAVAATETPKPTKTATAAGVSSDKWLFAYDGIAAADIWEIDTTTGTLTLLNHVPESVENVYDTAGPMSISGDGLATFGPISRGGTSVTVAGVHGGTGNSFDITALPDFQPGDVVSDAQFDLSTPEKFAVKVRNGDTERWYEYDALKPETTAVKLPGEPSIGYDKSAGYDEPWGATTQEDSELLTLNNAAGAYKLDVTTNSVTLFKKSAGDQFAKVGMSAPLVDSNVELRGWDWFRPADVTTLVK